jgi:hypothetical protein
LPDVVEPTAPGVTLPPAALEEFAPEALAQLAAQTNNPFVDIMEGNVPLGGITITSCWSLASAFMAILAIFSTFVITILSRAKRQRYSESDEEFTKRKRKGLVVFVIAVALGVLALGAWLLLDDLTLPMAWVNRFTPFVACLLVCHIIAAVIFVSGSRIPAEDDTDDKSHALQA